MQEVVFSFHFFFFSLPLLVFSFHFVSFLSFLDMLWYHSMLCINCILIGVMVIVNIGVVYFFFFMICICRLHTLWTPSQCSFISLLPLNQNTLHVLSLLPLHRKGDDWLSPLISINPAARPAVMGTQEDFGILGIRIWRTSQHNRRSGIVFAIDDETRGQRYRARHWYWVSSRWMSTLDRIMPRHVYSESMDYGSSSVSAPRSGSAMQQRQRDAAAPHFWRCYHGSGSSWYRIFVSVESTSANGGNWNGETIVCRLDCVDLMSCMCSGGID